MIVLGWLLSPLITLLALLHTALSSIVGLVAMGVNPSGGDWMMWNVGRRFWSRPLLRWVVGAKLDIDIHPEAQALADAGKGVVLVANHASLIDINAAFSASPWPIVFLSKASIRKVPLLGKLNELAGTVFVERGNRASSEQAVNQLTQTLKAGRSVLVFPEGTRSVDGSIQAFKKGAFHLAKAGGAHIVPMHIEGTHDRLPPNAWMFKPSNRSIRVRVGAPFSSDGTVDKLLTDARHRVLELGR